MGKKVLNRSNKNIKLRSILDASLKVNLDKEEFVNDWRFSNVALSVGALGIVSSCGNDKDKDTDKDTDNGDETKLKFSDFKDKFGTEDVFDKFIKKCKNLSDDEIRKIIAEISSEDIKNVIKSNEVLTKDANGNVKINGRSINVNKAPGLTQNNDTLDYNKLKQEHKDLLKGYGIDKKEDLDSFFSIKGNESFKNKKISDLFNDKNIKDNDFKAKLDSYKKSKEKSENNDEKIKKLKDLIGHKDDDNTIKNFYDNQISIKELNEFYEQIKDKDLSDEDKKLDKRDSLASKLNAIIEKKENVKALQLSMFKKIVEKLGEGSDYFKFSSDDKNKLFKIEIKFEIKDEDGKNKKENITKEYQVENTGIEISKELNIEENEIYTSLSSLKDITKDSITKIFNLTNAKDKDNKDIADGAGDVDNLNAYLVVLKGNFDEAKKLDISDKDIESKIHGQLLTNIKGKLNNFVGKKLQAAVKNKDISDADRIAAIKNTKICKDDAKDINDIKNKPVEGKFFLSAIIGTDGFMYNEYKSMIDDMDGYLKDKYKIDNAAKFKKNIVDLTVDHFTAADANTKLKIDANNSNKCTYFEEDSVSNISGYAKFEDVINKINAIGNVKPDGTDPFNSGKTLANAIKLDYISTAFKAIHDVRKALDDVVSSTNDPDRLIKGSKIYKFMERIVGEKGDFKLSLGWYGDGTTAKIKHDVEYKPNKTTYITEGLLPLAIMLLPTNHKLNDATFYGDDNTKSLGKSSGGGTNVTGQFQSSLEKLSILYLKDQKLSFKTERQSAVNCDFKLGDCTNVANSAAEANKISLSKGDGTIADYEFVTQLNNINVEVTKETEHEKQVKKFLDSYVKKIFIPGEIKCTGAKKNDNPGTAIFVDPDWQGSGANQIVTATDKFQKLGLCLTVGDIGTYLLPVLGPIHLIAGFLGYDDDAANMKAADGSATIVYKDQKYLYDFTNNRSALNAGELNGDKTKYTYGVTINNA